MSRAQPTLPVPYVKLVPNSLTKSMYVSGLFEKTASFSFSPLRPKLSESVSESG